MRLPDLTEARKRTKNKTEVSYDKYKVPTSIHNIGHNKKYTILTYGCQMNVHDSENISGIMEDLGYTKEQVLHSTIHMDEKTPHIHCVVVPLVKKFDKRTNTERYTISKKQYIKNNEHLSELQDKYHNRLVKAGFDLERGLKGSTAENINIKEFKKMTRRLDKTLEKS